MDENMGRKEAGAKNNRVSHGQHQECCADGARAETHGKRRGENPFSLRLHVFMHEYS